MGQTSSRAAVEEIVNAGLRVANKVNQECFQTLDLSNVLEFRHLKNVSVHDIKQKNVGTLSSNCGTSTSADSKVFQDIKNAISQQAETVRNALIPESGTVSSETYTKLVTNLSTEVINAYSQQCGQKLYAENRFTVVDAEHGDIYGIDQESYLQGQQQCVMTNVMKSDAANELVSTIDQAAKTESKDPFGTFAEGLANLLSSPLLIIGLVIVVFVVVLMKVGGGGGGSGWMYFIIGMIVLVVIGLIAYKFYLEKDSKKS